VRVSPAHAGRLALNRGLGHILHRIAELQADALVRRHPTLRIASLRLHWSLPETLQALSADPTRRARDLWGWVQEDVGADAFLRALTAPEGAWVGHERFFIVAPQTAGMQVASEALRAKFYPDVPVRDGFDMSGHQSFFDCGKAERVLGWVHPPT
jgi:nucleoside-diphosphate-sugar epimerase